MLIISEKIKKRSKKKVFNSNEGNNVPIDLHHIPK
jgi:hypothetical protein